MFIESLDTRHLMIANGGLDPTFGTNGRLELPAVSADATAVLAVGRSIYVAASAQLGKNDYAYPGVFKFDDIGRLDTTWGVNGFARYADANAPLRNVTQLAYDGRTGSLWAAGSTTYGGTDGGALISEVGVGRFDSAGRSTVTYPFSRPQYQVTEQRLTFDRIVPLPHSEAVVLFDREIETFAGLGDGDDAFQDILTREVVVMKLGTNGQRDATFGRRGLRTVLQGMDVTDYQTRFETHTSDVPTGSDVQARSDGSFRVIDTRRRGVAQYSTKTAGGAHTGEVLNSTALVDSSVVAADGVVHPEARRVWRIAHTTGVSDNKYDVFDFSPKLAVADGDGVLYVGGRSETTQVYLRLTPGVRPPVTALPSGPGTLVRTVQRDEYGVLLTLGYATITELSPQLVVNNAFADDGTASIDDVDPYGSLGIAATDAKGRVLVVGATVSSATGVPVLQRYGVFR